ncbi:hypothetical protein B0H11DRAFT_2254563 [Mycena galericulata]|nr:hypothetical protein B0H11DRAFT_2254563 [Mycena galericulata]
MASQASRRRDPPTPASRIFTNASDTENQPYFWRSTDGARKEFVEIWDVSDTELLYMRVSARRSVGGADTNEVPRSPSCSPASPTPHSADRGVRVRQPHASLPYHERRAHCASYRRPPCPCYRPRRSPPAFGTALTKLLARVKDCPETPTPQTPAFLRRLDERAILGSKGCHSPGPAPDRAQISSGEDAPRSREPWAHPSLRTRTIKPLQICTATVYVSHTRPFRTMSGEAAAHRTTDPRSPPLVRVAPPHMSRV